MTTRARNECPCTRAFAVPDVRLLGDSVELSAPVVLVVVVDPDAPEEDPLPLFEGEVVVLAAPDATRPLPPAWRRPPDCSNRLACIRTREP